jgi:hypothetical protein
MNSRLSNSKYTTTDLWLRKGSNPPKPIRNKITNRSIRPVRINDQDKANERNYRPRFLKSNPRPYVPVFGDEQQEAAAQQDEQPDTSATVEELMSLIDDKKVQESDFELLVDAAENLSGPEQIMLNRRLFESASRGAQKMLQILNPEPGKEEPSSDEEEYDEGGRKALAKLIGNQAVARRVANKRVESNLDILREERVKDKDEYKFDFENRAKEIKRSGKRIKEQKENEFSQPYDSAIGLKKTDSRKKVALKELRKYAKEYGFKGDVTHMGIKPLKKALRKLPVFQRTKKTTLTGRGKLKRRKKKSR